MKKVLMLFILTAFSMSIAAVEPLFTESFEGANFPPEGWKIVDKDGDGKNWKFFGTNAHTGSLCAASASWETDALNPHNYLITPKITIPEAGAKLKFWVDSQDDNFYQEHYKVLVSKTGNDVENFVDTIYSETLSLGTWEERTVMLSDYVGQDIHIAFVHCESTDLFLIKLDDVSVEAVSTVPEISILPENPDFGMQLVNEESSVVEFSISNYGADTITINEGNLFLSGADKDEFLLDSSLTYPIKIGSGDIINFNIRFTPSKEGEKDACLVVEDNLSEDKMVENKIDLIAKGYFPFAVYSTGFEVKDIPVLPAAWNKLINSVSSWSKIGTTNVAEEVYSGEKAFYMFNGGDNDATLIAITPKFTNCNKNRISFMAYNKGSKSNAPNKRPLKSLDMEKSRAINLVAGIIKDPKDPATFIAYDTVSIDRNWERYTMSFPDTIEGDNYFALKHGTGSQGYIFVDDFMWEEKPAGPFLFANVDTLNFERSAVGTSVTKYVQLKNDGSGEINIKAEDISIEGEDASNFSVVAADTTLTEGKSTFISVIFNPSSEKEFAADLKLVTNSLNSELIIPIRASSFYGLNETFEGQDMPSNWTIIDENNDGRTWHLGSTYAHGGSFSAQMLYSQNGTEDSHNDYLVTPKLHIRDDNSELSYWASSWMAPYLEDYEVRVSTSGKEAADFTEVLESITELPIGFEEHKVSLSKYIGKDIYIAFRCISVKKFMLFIDDVHISSAEGMEENVTKGTMLSQNYPNPFNPVTTINFNIVKQGLVKLAIYNVRGELVNSLINKNLSPGSHQIKFDGSRLNSGVYYYRLQTKGMTLTKKMVLVK